MKLKLIGKPYAEAEVNLNDFKKSLSEDWNMEKAIKNNTIFKFNKHKELSEEQLRNLVWGALDWAGIMDALGETHEDIMKVHFYFVEYNDWKRLYPGTVVNGKEVELVEEAEDGHATILIQSLVKNRNFDLKAFIKQGQFTYAPTKNKLVGWVVR